MNTNVLVVLVLVGIFVAVYSQPGCPRTGDFGICAFTCRVGRRCGRGRICCRTACGGSSCVDRVGGPGGPGGSGVPPWCPTGSPRIFCLVNPCTVMTCPRIPWARCRNDNPCERACSGNFYVGRRRVPRWVCDLPRRGRRRG